MTQRLSLPDPLWRITRKRAFDEGISASGLVERALLAYLDEGTTTPPDPLGLYADDIPPRNPLGMSPWDDLVGTSSNSSIAVAASPEDKGEIDLAARAIELAKAKGREFHPVPKPVAKGKKK